MWNLLGFVLLVAGACGLLVMHIPRLLTPTFSGAQFGLNTLRYMQASRSAAIVKFRRAITDFHRKREVLDSYADQCLGALQGAGWNELNDLLDNLDFAHRVVDNLLHTGDYAAADSLANLLTDSLSETEAAKTKKRFGSVESLIGWQDRASRLIVDLSRVVELTAREESALGVDCTDLARESTTSRQYTQHPH